MATKDDLGDALWPTICLATLAALGLATLGATLPASAGAEPPSEALLQEVGRDLFARHCAVCHGVDAKGDGPAASALKQAPADLTRIRERRGGEFPVAELARTIDGRTQVSAHGSREMPIWGVRFSEELSDETMGEEWARGQIGVLLDYLETLQRP